MVTKQKLRTTLVILIVKLRNIILSGIFKSKYVTYFIPLSANPTKWSNTLKTILRQFADELFECV